MELNCFFFNTDPIHLPRFDLFNHRGKTSKEFPVSAVDNYGNDCSSLKDNLLGKQMLKTQNNDS